MKTVLKKSSPYQFGHGGARSVTSDVSTDIGTESSSWSAASLLSTVIDARAPPDSWARKQTLYEGTEEDITDVNGLYYTAKAMPPLQEEPPPLPAGWIAKELEEPPPLPCGEAAVYCEDCEMWLNGPTQWEDHKIGKKHKKNIQGAGPASATPKPKDKGIEIPKLTAALIEQSALWDDAVSTYCLSVYRRAALRSRI
jgi:hypothetical protein